MKTWSKTYIPSNRLAKTRQHIHIIKKCEPDIDLGVLHSIWIVKGTTRLILIGSKKCLHHKVLLEKFRNKFL